jgi:hypothetical protein
LDATASWLSRRLSATAIPPPAATEITDNSEMRAGKMNARVPLTQNFAGRNLAVRIAVDDATTCL